MHPGKPGDELVAYVKANPGKVTYGSVGTGTTNHLVTARIGSELGLDWKHVPFQGGVKATTALLGGHVDIINNTAASVASSLRAGKIRALLITSETPFSLTPDVPTIERERVCIFPDFLYVYHPKFMRGKEYQALLEKISKEWGELLEKLGVKVQK